MEIDSKEELYFSYWCEELEQAGYIKTWGKAKTYTLGEKIVNKYTEQLKTKTKEKEQTILNSCEYTPDFEIHWNTEAYQIFVDNLVYDNMKVNTDLILCNGFSGTSIIEIKANFDSNNMTRLNTINRKWMMQKYGLYVNLVKVPDIFKDMFTPQRYLLTDSGKQSRLIHFKTKTLEEYVREKENINTSI
jgi:hypothetical protein